jgi:hypothetical protein
VGNKTNCTRIVLSFFSSRHLNGELNTFSLPLSLYLSVSLSASLHMHNLTELGRLKTNLAFLFSWGASLLDHLEKSAVRLPFSTKSSMGSGDLHPDCALLLCFVRSSTEILLSGDRAWGSLCLRMNRYTYIHIYIIMSLSIYICICIYIFVDPVSNTVKSLCMCVCVRNSPMKDSQCVPHVFVPLRCLGT